MWQTVPKPRDHGGLGVPDLDKFGRVLCLRWLWQDWVDGSKPWAGVDLPCKPADRLLFNASTIITIGNRVKAQFWHRNWLDGEAPRNLAPHLFELVRRKNRSVQQELHNKWIRFLKDKIMASTHVEEFGSLE